MNDLITVIATLMTGAAGGFWVWHCIITPAQQACRMLQECKVDPPKQVKHDSTLKHV